MSRPMQRRILRKILSNGLPDSMSGANTPNQIAKGILVMEIIQMVGIHNARDTLGVCFLSILSIKRTKTVHRNNASTGGMGAKDSPFAVDSDRGRGIYQGHPEVIPY